MLEYLQTTESHYLTLEKVYAENWLELRERKTGLTRVLIFKNKAKARSFFKGMAMQSVVEFYDKQKIQAQKVYDENT